MMRAPSSASTPGRRRDGEAEELVVHLQEEVRALQRAQQEQMRESDLKEDEILRLRAENYRLRNALEREVRASGTPDAVALLQVYKAQTENSMLEVEALQAHIRSLNSECGALDSENVTLSALLGRGIPLQRSQGMSPSAGRHTPVPQERHWVFGL
eukprot:TRINITY_DN8318_c0_g1_i1.p2 TRINITY_DN8318_c0_g1~~TRINITY_DN8318_c0_g1_i1.p2  ORF type:complete len:156 (+),score=50.06 TRINITY_DN8318_c0_g1_i1:334-801(+)